MKVYKLDNHPDRELLLNMLKEGKSHKDVQNWTYDKYPPNSPTKHWRVSSAAISRYINREIPKSLEPPRELQKRLIVQKIEDIEEAKEELSLSEEFMNNLKSLIHVQSQLLSEGRSIKEVKYLAETIQIYHGLIQVSKREEDPNSTPISYDDLMQAEINYENDNLEEEDEE